MVAALAALAALAGCAATPPEATRPVLEAARQKLGVPIQPNEDARQRVQVLLARPLDADAAVELALLNNPGLQADLQSLGVAAADLAQASTLQNPALSLSVLRGGGDTEIDRGISFNLAQMLTLPLARQQRTLALQNLQQQTVQRMLSLASEARKAQIRAVAAAQSLAYALDVQGAADAAAELAGRMAAAGNWSELHAFQEQNFASTAGLRLAQAKRAQSSAQERLARVLGLEKPHFQLPERLPDLPAELPAGPVRDAADTQAEQLAMAQRLDLRTAREQAQATARQLGLTRSSRFINVLELEPQDKSVSGQPVERGAELRFELPLFDWGEARVARAEAVYMRSVHEAAQTAVAARSQIREALARRHATLAIAHRYADEILPHARRVGDETLLRYNGMLVGVFELLADARAQAEAVDASLTAQRDYWLAQADLDLALIGPSTPLNETVP